MIRNAVAFAFLPGLLVAQERVVRIADAFAVERMDAISLAPDGAWAGYHVPWRQEQQRSGGHGRILVALPGQRAIDITPPFATGAFLHELGPTGMGLKWSPDAQWLAGCAVVDGSQRLMVWNRRTREWKDVAPTRPVEAKCKTFEWLTPTTLLVRLFPVGAKPVDVFTEVDGLPVHLARVVAHYRKRIEGKEPSVSVLDAGQAGPVGAGGASDATVARPAGGARGDSADVPTTRDLVAIDLATGVTRTVVAGYRPADYTNIDWMQSPDGKFVTYWVGAPGEDIPTFPRIRGELGIEIRAVDGSNVQIARTLPRNIRVRAARWSPDGKQLALISGGRPEDTTTIRQPRMVPTTLWRVNPTTGAVDSLDLGDLDVAGGSGDSNGYTGFEWVRPGVIIVQGSRRAAAGTIRRRDWFLVTPNGRLSLLTEAMPEPPSGETDDLWVPAIGADLVALERGDVWKLDLQTRSFRNLTSRVSDSLGWMPQLAVLNQNTYTGQVWWARREGTKVLAGTGRLRSEGGKYWWIDTESGRVTAVRTPNAKAAVRGVAQDTRALLWATESLILRTDSVGGGVDTLATVNSWRERIKRARAERLVYKSLKGRTIGGWLVYPDGYVPGRKYPLIAQVYPTRRALCCDLYNLTMGRSAIYAAMGYAVLYPDMPPFNEDWKQPDIRETMADLPDGVLPALDTLIARGIVDADRMVVAGGSGGGFATYGLVVQTNRFKAAQAWAGWVDYILSFGAFRPGKRYEDDAEHASSWSFFQNEDHHGLKVPPWKDFDRYVRNSPLFHLEKSTTPMMIVQGDMDYVPMENGEVWFSWSQAMGKPVRFVRYYNEGHSISGRANVIDLWQRTFAWFDEWTDVSRDAAGRLVFEGDRVKSRGGAPALKPGDFAKFDAFMSGDEASKAGRMPWAVSPK